MVRLVPCPLSRLGMGLVALGLMLVAEFGLVLWLRGLSIKEYLATRDPVSGTVYYVMLWSVRHHAASRDQEMKLGVCPVHFGAPASHNGFNPAEISFKVAAR